MSIDAPSGVHNVAESENTLFSAGNCPARVDAIVAFKVVHAKGISGKEAVSAHVPWVERADCPCDLQLCGPTLGR